MSANRSPSYWVLGALLLLVALAAVWRFGLQRGQGATDAVSTSAMSTEASAMEGATEARPMTQPTVIVDPPAPTPPPAPPPKQK